jgi:predicted metal-dependent HD superfamily phosphohydrolase
MVSARSAPLEIPPAMMAGVRAAYAKPPRAYHHFGHVQEVLGHFADVADAEGWQAPREVWLAMLFHDAIYDAGARDNEARSAALAREAIATYLPDAGLDVGRIERWILLTAQHGRIDQDAVHDDDTRHFLDCDMAILGSAPDLYDHYERSIAKEYAAVPADAYRLGRAAFLSGLLARPRIFLSDRFHASHDEPARANLQRALAPLSG